MNTKCKFKVGDKVVNVRRARSGPLSSDHWYGTTGEMAAWEMNKTELEVTEVTVDYPARPDHWRVEAAEKVGREAYWYHEDELDFAPQNPNSPCP